ncbi:hypothetical protein, partial [Streptomyces sp. SAS_270]|uniref:hypothetical protein n=1 Tax=Streptomyces sp. SAS_270 TaxID=3412748 RepID=UPI00403C850E
LPARHLERVNPGPNSGLHGTVADCINDVGAAAVICWRRWGPVRAVGGCEQAEEGREAWGVASGTRSQGERDCTRRREQWSTITAGRSRRYERR